MRRQVECKNEAHDLLKDNSVPNTVTLDNDTMVEVLKHMNYCQLAKSCLVSKRYRGLIQKNRHKLALLKVDHIGLSIVPNASVHIYVFGRDLSSKANNDLVIRNHYSRRVPLESHANEMKLTKRERKLYQFWVYADYKDPNNVGPTTVFCANAKLMHENGPLFQHFVSLLTDPFIYISYLELISQDFLSLIAGTIRPDFNRVKCNKLVLNADAEQDPQHLRDNTPKFITWIKDHVLCNEFRLNVHRVSNCDEEFLDLFMTGANCTSKIYAGLYDLCDVVVGFVQKFKELNSCDENQLVESIWGIVMHRSVEGMKRYFTKFIAKEGEGHRSNAHILEFVNNDIGKKLLLTIENNYWYSNDKYMSDFSIKINNL